jgi:hypothetical protein
MHRHLVQADGLDRARQHDLIAADRMKPPAVAASAMSRVDTEP